MRILKIILVIGLGQFISQPISAQQNAKGIKDQGVKGCGSCGLTGGRISFGGNISNPQINNNNVVNQIGFGLDYFYPFIVLKNISCGASGGGTYFTGSSDPFGGYLPQTYKVLGEITNTVSSLSNTRNTSGFFVGTGPQINFAITDRLLFSPIFQVGYFGLSQNEFKATETITIQNIAPPHSLVTKTYDLVSQTETKTSGLGLLPKARFSYMVTNNIGIWGEASYMMGPTITNNLTIFKPQSIPNAQGYYLQQRMDAGTYTSTMSETKYNALGFGFGLSMNLGKSPTNGIAQKATSNQPCYLDAKLSIDKYRCCNDSLIIEGHFEVENSRNVTINKLAISKLSDNLGQTINNPIVGSSITKGAGNAYSFIIKLNNRACKNDLIIDYFLEGTCTKNGVSEPIESKKTNLISKQELPCCSCEKWTEQNTSNQRLKTVVIDSNQKPCSAEAVLKVLKLNCCGSQLVLNGYFDIKNGVNSTIDNITISQIKDNKGNALKGSFTLPLKINKKSTGFDFEIKLDKTDCNKDIIIEYQINTICTTNKIEKAEQYKGSKIILQKEIPCCGCDDAQSSTLENKCENNPIVNGDFLDAPVSAGIMPIGKVNGWEPGYGKPKVLKSLGCLDSVYIELSGNKLIGDAITQKLSSNFKKGKKYKITFAAKFIKGNQKLDYGKLSVMAFNGIYPSSTTHPFPNTDIAIVGRSPKIHDCGDWSFIELPVWKAHKDFGSIAINAFTNDSIKASSIFIDNISLCETIESSCVELPVDGSGNPIIPPDLGTIPSTFACTTQDDEDSYFNGNLSDLHGYNGTFDMYNQGSSDETEECYNIGGELPPAIDSFDCSAELLAAGITETCGEAEALINSVQNVPQQAHNYPIIPPLASGYCNSDGGDIVPNNLKSQMAFGGRDIIYIHGLEMVNLIDRAKGVPGAMTNWPDKKEFYKGGYYKGVAEKNWSKHISYYKNGMNGFYPNRYLIVTYNSSQDAETAIHSLATQIRDAIETSEGVVMDAGDMRFITDEAGNKKAQCFGREFVIISHSTGGLVTDILLSTANKTKIAGAERTKYGNIGYISDRCKGHVAMHSAISGSNVAAVAVALVPKAAATLQATDLLATALSSLYNYSLGTSFSTVSLNDLNPHCSYIVK
jgi:hypothetical protein